MCGELCAGPKKSSSRRTGLCYEAVAEEAVCLPARGTSGRRRRREEEAFTSREIEPPPASVRTRHVSDEARRGGRPGEAGRRTGNEPGGRGCRAAARRSVPGRPRRGTRNPKMNDLLHSNIRRLVVHRELRLTSENIPLSLDQ